MTTSEPSNDSRRETPPYVEDDNPYAPPPPGDLDGPIEIFDPVKTRELRNRLGRTSLWFSLVFGLFLLSLCGLFLAHGLHAIDESTVSWIGVAIFFVFAVPHYSLGFFLAHDTYHLYRAMENDHVNSLGSAVAVFFALPLSILAVILLIEKTDRRLYEAEMGKYKTSR